VPEIFRAFFARYFPLICPAISRTFRGVPGSTSHTVVARRAAEYSFAERARGQLVAHVRRAVVRPRGRVLVSHSAWLVAP
jgi:hypothetical protein